MMDDRVGLLRRFPLWSGFSDEILQVVAAAMEEIAYAPGDAIIRAGEPGRHFSVLLSGRADVRVSHEGTAATTVATLAAGDSVGEMSLLGDAPTSADVIALEPCATLALGKEAFHELIARHPILLREFVALLSRRLRAGDLNVAVARQKQEDLARFIQEQRSERYSALIGGSKPVKDLGRAIDARAASSKPLLIRGEKGAGKELAARLVHARGPRRERPLVATECSQVTENPWGDQLFGLYDAGAAAHARGMSYLALAEGGTLLLKNVQALPPAIQERLVRFLKGEPLPSGARPDVRVIATCRGNLLEEAACGRFSTELAALLLEDVIEAPALREHKRDIPELARHFLKRHAARLGKKAADFEDAAMTRLVSYDYLFANVQELEESIERAVIISDGETVAADAVFLGLPPLDKPRGFNLLSLPKPLVNLGLALFPRGVRAMAALGFALILYACFFMAPETGGKVATLLVWAVWWPALVLSFFFAGRAWCAICPMAFSGQAAQGFARRFFTERKVPAWLKDNDVALMTAGFFVIVWAEEVTGMRHSPVATGWLLLAIISGAVITGVLLPRRAWCRHLCPMGGFAGLCATSSLLELRPTADICSAKCKGHSCYKGEVHVPGCPMFQHVMFVDSNRDCVLCLDCVRSCPNGSPQLNVRVPARELWTTISARPEVARLVMLLLGLLVAQALIQHWEAPGAGGSASLMAALLHERRGLFVSALLAIAAAVPLAGLWLRSRRYRGEADPVAQTLHWQRVTAAAPLLGAGYAAYQFGNIPGFDLVRLSLGGIAPGLLPDPLVSIALQPLAQAFAVAVGLALTVGTLWKIWPADAHERGVRWYRAQAFSLGAATTYAAVLLVLMVGPPWMPA
jgi:transcriptional regulator with AAA-type ATPase domain